MLVVHCFPCSFTLADTVRRYIFVNHSDPAARDDNGFMQGSYYLGVFGWCTPDEYVLNWTTDGPCSYAANVPFNVTVELFEYSEEACAYDSLHFPTDAEVGNYTKLTSGIEYTSLSVPCNEYEYFSIDVPEPCNNLEVVTYSTNNTDYTVSELAIGKYPNTKPTFDNLQWTSFEWGVNNLTISAWDPR